MVVKVDIEESLKLLHITKNSFENQFVLENYSEYCKKIRYINENISHFKAQALEIYKKEVLLEVREG